ncbi:MAG: metal-dependent hydrolase [Nitrospira sp.]|nr:MAG: metal-dependent hydrolase [Nitrospira sp.]
MRKAKELPSQEADLLRHAVHYWASRIGVQPIRVQILSMKRKWASCSTTGWIRFSKDLIKEDLRFREVVIVHELLHLQVPNHGKLFKSLMNAYLPHWQKIARGKIARVCPYDRHDRSIASE